MLVWWRKKEDNNIVIMVVKLVMLVVVEEGRQHNRDGVVKREGRQKYCGGGVRECVKSKQSWRCSRERGTTIKLLWCYS